MKGIGYFWYEIGRKEKIAQPKEGFELSVLQLQGNFFPLACVSDIDT